MYSVIVDEAVFDEIVRRLVEAVDPDRIILFGSRARGDARPDSDVDLLIEKDSQEPPGRRDVRAYRALMEVGVPADVLWYTPQEVVEWAGVKSHVVSRALREGKVLYEKR